MTPDLMMTPPVFVTELHDVIPLAFVAADDLCALVSWLLRPLREAFLDLMAVNLTDVWVIFGGMYVLIFVICILDHHHTHLYTLIDELELLKSEHVIMAMELKEWRELNAPKKMETRARQPLRAMIQPTEEQTMKKDDGKAEELADWRLTGNAIHEVKTQCAISFKRLVSLEKKVKNLQQTVRLFE